MKTLKIFACFFIALIISIQYSNGQEVVATTKIANNPASTPASSTDAIAEEKKEKEDEPKFTLSGSIDTYFHTTFGTTWDGNKSTGTSFANMPGFGLGMANLIGTYAGEKVGFTADLVFGPRGKDAVFGNAYTSQGIINQMFAYYKISDKVTLNLGQFNTFLGYEVISPAVNFHYSTSYMFSWGPFNHTGLRADFDLGGGMNAKLSVMNPTDMVEFNPVNTYTLGGQLGYTNDAGGIWFNVLYGDQDGKLDEDDGLTLAQTSEGTTFQTDLTTGWNLSEKFYLGFNGTFRTVAKGEFYNGSDIDDIDEDAKGFLGAAIYPKLTLSETFALGLRAEYFQITKGYLYYTNDDDDAVPYAFNRDDEGTGSVTAFTLSANYKVGGLTIIPEIRTDITSEDSYFKKGEADPTTQMLSFNLATVYKF